MAAIYEKPRSGSYGGAAPALMSVVFMSIHGVYLFLFPAANLSSGIAGAFIYSFSLWLYWASVKEAYMNPFYSGAAAGSLIRSGPYRWMRQPLYTAYLLAWTAGAFASGRWALVFSAAAMFFMYMNLACEEEEDRENGICGEIYEHYKTRTGQFLPRRELIEKELSAFFESLQQKKVLDAQTEEESKAA